MGATEIYKELRESFNLQYIAEKLSLHIGTLKRWESKNKIPDSYLYDLNFLLGNKYELKKQNFRSHSEFFTKKEVAKYCFDEFSNFLKIHNIDSSKYTFIEPSCGDSSFYKLMPKNRKIGIDLEHRGEGILTQNFLDFSPKQLVAGKKFITLGNPPFGLRGNLALRFINHASNFSDFIAFILPPLFMSDGKGNPKKRVKNLSLASNIKLPLNSFIYPDGKVVEVATIFQIWVNNALIEQGAIKIEKQHPKTCKNFIKIYSLSDGGTPSSTRNKAMLYKCDLYLPSTCFNSKNNKQMRIYHEFEELPHRRGYGIVILQERERVRSILEQINWEHISFLGTNSSLNLRTSLIEEALIKCGIYDKDIFDRDC